MGFIFYVELNFDAAQVDPQRVWKTPWRWYAEELLECCSPLMAVKQKGITLIDFACLARCNGCDCVTSYAETGTEEEYQRLKAAVISVCHAASAPSEPADRAWLPKRHLIVSYSRKALQQTGSGHFSPIAAWDPVSESVLVFTTLLLLLLLYLPPGFTVLL
jgi:glutathione gamma-glutamylcysteinyltransferase